MKFLILFLLLVKCWALHIYESYSEPYSIRPLPHVFMTSNNSRTLDLFNFFQGFNLSFFFYDLKDPYLTATSSPTINYFEKKPFKSGFLNVIEMGSFTVILANPNQIYTAIIEDNQGELSFSVQDFLNIDSQYTCSNILALNETLLLIDCVQNNTINGYFLTISLDNKFKFLDETLISSTYNLPYKNDSQINDQYMACYKEMRYQNNVFLRFCKKNPRVSGFFEIFAVNNGSVQKISVINSKDVDIELFIVDIAIYQVESANNFKIFLLDQLFGPCSINYFNNTIELLTDFPSILGENYYFLRFDPIFYIVYVVSSHYISGISLSFESSAKTLNKRVNFGSEMEILNFDLNDNYFLVHTKQANSTFLNIYSKTTQNTRFLYKISLNVGESFISLQLEENKGLFIYDSLHDEYRLISLGNCLLQISCCQGATIPDTYLPYNRTLTFLVSASDEISGQVTQIYANLNISIVKNNVIFDDYMGFRLFIVNPRNFAPEHEFFFSNGEVPDGFKMVKSLGFYCNEDRFSLGIKDNEKNYAIIPGNSWGNSLHGMQSQILDSSQTLPLINVDQMVVTCNVSDSVFVNTYNNPLVLGYLDDIFFNIKIDINGKIQSCNKGNEVIDIQTNILDFDGQTFIHLRPNLSSIIVNFSESFLNNHKNNITLFELKKQDSLNLEGFYDGFVEDYIFEFEDNESNETNSSILDEYTKNSVFLQKYIELSSNESNSLFAEENITKSLLHKDFAFILTDTMIYLYGTPPIYQNFTQIDSINLSTVSVLFDSCFNVFIHDSLPVLILFCESKNNSQKPKRLIFIGFSYIGFEKVIKQAPLPSYINIIEKSVFLENLLFIIEKKVDSLNECFIHVFLLNPKDLIGFQGANLKNYIVIDIIFENYKRMDAETFDVDYLILKNLQIRLMGKLNSLMVIGILMNDKIGLYYTEFTVNVSNETREFIGDISKLKKIRLREIVGNYSHDLPLNNGFFWIETDDFGCLKLIIYNQYNLVEAQISRFYWESFSIIRKYQGFYDCFHSGIIASNDQYLLEFCQISENSKSLITLYVKKNKDLLFVSQTLSFSENMISDILLNGNYLLVIMKDGRFLKYNVKQGISLERNYTMKGNSLFFGTLTAQNRFSNSSIVITIKPEILIDEKLDIALLFLVVFPIVLSFLGFISLLIYIYFRKKKRKDDLKKKFLKEIY